MIGVGWIDPHRVMVRMRRARGVPEGAAAIRRHLKRNSHEVDAIRIRRINAHLTHVPWIGEAYSHSLPARAVIVGAINTSFSISGRCAGASDLRLDRRVDDIGIRSAYIEAY